ncbi:NERD domain-containing protein/DEAD/DEAH box helicase [bacterium]|nr:NERD domain-containing protein/DEAD/DEAH box helicase [bacterium]
MPPRFCPPLGSLPIDVKSEATVARLLNEQLGPEWAVFHSYPWLTSRSGRMEQGESDFVLLHARGLIVLEVKGGRISYDPDTREWNQNQHWMKDPFDQASKGMHLLWGQLGGSDFVRGYAAAFPGCRFVGSLPPGVVRSILLDAEDLKSLETRLHQMLADWGQGRPAPTKAESERLRKALLPRCQLIPDLHHEVSDEERVLHTLTRVQMDTLAGLFSMNRVLIQGVAGSGKTLLAVQRATDLAQQGMKALFLCYNKNLAQDLRASQARENLDFYTFHELCHRSCQLAGLPFEVGEASDWWDVTPPELLMEALERRPDLGYDALLVDEGQDFRSTWWVAALSLLPQETSPCYIFYDPEQNLYKTELDLPNFAGRFVLRQNCRNTQKIARSCQRLQSDKSDLQSQAPEGRAPQVAMATDPLEALRLVKAHLAELVGSLTPQSVAVLSPYSRTKSVCAEMESLTVDLVAWRRGEAPLFSTIRGFKGLEASAVLLVDVPEFDEKAAAKTDVYVALTRAKNELRIITSNPGLADLLGV